MVSTGLPSPVRLCTAVGDVEKFLWKNAPVNPEFLPQLDGPREDVYMVTVDLDSEHYPMHWWGRADTSDDIHAHLRAMFRRENPYIRVVALATQPMIPSLFW